MILNELKASWQAYDTRVTARPTLPAVALHRAIHQRSRSRLAYLSRLQLVSLVLNVLWVILLAVVVATNPFGFGHPAQLLPFGALAVCISVVVFFSARSYRQMQQVELSHLNLEHALRQVITLFEKPWTHLRWTIALLMAAAAVLPVSFLPAYIQWLGFWPAVAGTVGLVASLSVMYYLIFRSTAFQQAFEAFFQKELADLAALKSTAAELHDASNTTKHS